MTSHDIARIIERDIANKRRIISNNRIGIDEIKADFLQTGNFTQDALRSAAKRIEARQAEIKMIEYCIKEMQSIIDAIEI